MIDYSSTLELIASSRLKPWTTELPQKIKEGFDVSRWGDLPKWEGALKALPELDAAEVSLDSGSVTVGNINDCADKDRDELEKQLRLLYPWRKGPFTLFGVHIDTEWRSDFKWDRLKDHIAPLEGRLVLDVGCGNGYHCWRMAGARAQMAVGIDPTLIYVYQFHAFQKYINKPNSSVFPFGIDDMPRDFPCFDTVFSMGLLYHRRAPLDHLLQLRSFLREGGELVLETLVIDGGSGEVLAPSGRYARMPNVWFIPSVLTLEHWLKRMKFTNIRCIDATKTTSQEQRATNWIGSPSLADFLDPRNSDLTIEGYPAPKRAIFLANRAV